jgi:L-ascorbate metabolism protein UlaG (beta-lactamase superfamily)
MPITDKIKVNAQSSIRIEDEGVVLWFDPFMLDEEPHDADVVFFTHGHYDHFSVKDFPKVIKAGTMYVAPASIQKDLTDAGIDKANAVFLKPGEKTIVKGIQIEAVPSYNILKRFHPKRKEWIGYVITIDGQRIYITGDMDRTKEAEQVKCDVIMLPIGGKYTMTAKEAAGFVNEIHPDVAIPTHYGSIVGSPQDADEFEKNVAHGIEVVRKLHFK